MTNEQIARLFHETYERLAPTFGYETRKETREFDPESANGKLMIAVVSEVIDWYDAAVTASASETRETVDCYHCGPREIAQGRCLCARRNLL